MERVEKGVNKRDVEMRMGRRLKVREGKGGGKQRMEEVERGD